VAWQLHYTSAKSGPTGRAGFQFVAATPGLPPGAEAAVGPYLTYRPPPDAPAAPGPGELSGFPVAFSYDLADRHVLLVRCRYLGRDYSGRYGNFFAHAVVAEPGELVGLRPIELWRAGFWRDSPARGDLPRLDDLVPEDALDPGALARWLAAERAYGLLTAIVDAVAAAIGRGHGRVILVADDVELIARWIAVVCYSLPAAAAAALSFVTYTDDVGGAPYRIAGTTPGIWAAAGRPGPAFLLDPPEAGAGGPGAGGRRRPGRFARAAADRWREHDLAGLDALGELAALGTGAARFDTAAALLALSRGEPGVTAAEESAAAELLRRHGADVPEWVWRDLAPALPGVGFDLAAALCDLTTGELAERCAARCVLLALADPALRPRLPRRAFAPALSGRGPAAPTEPRELPEPPAASGTRSRGKLRQARARRPPDGPGTRSRNEPPPEPPKGPRARSRGRLGPAGPAEPPRGPGGRSRSEPGPAWSPDPPEGTGTRSRSDLGPAFAAAVAAAPSLIEIAAIAAFAERCRVPLAGADVAAAAADRAGPGAADLLAAVHAAPPPLRDSLLTGALAGLETAAAAAGGGAAPLTDPVCDLAVGQDLSATPRVALRVLSSVGRRRKARRVELTREAIILERPGLPPEEIDAALRSLWAGTAPTVAECSALLDSWGPDSVAAVLTRYPALALLPSRAFAAALDDLDTPEVVRLARRIDSVPWRDGGAATLRADASVVIGYAALARTAVHSLDVAAMARSLDDIAAAPGSPALLDTAFSRTVERLAGRPSEVRQSLLAAVGEPARARLTDLLPAGPERHGLDRRRLFRRRGG
jgi:hypothetical protein